jgi:NADPH:quinone reductase-like Zn-dependent oxidoreductase
MASSPTSEMLSICIPSYTKPSGYGLAKFPKPVVEADTDVVIKVHAASINPIDLKKADGALSIAVKDRLERFSHTIKMIILI